MMCLMMLVRLTATRRQASEQSILEEVLVEKAASRARLLSTDSMQFLALALAGNLGCAKGRVAVVGRGLFATSILLSLPCPGLTATSCSQKLGIREPGRNQHAAPHTP